MLQHVILSRLLLNDVSNNKKRSLKCMYLDANRSAVREDNIVIIAGDTAVAFLNVLRNVLANTLDASGLWVWAYAAAIAISQDHSGAIFCIFRVFRIVEQIRRNRQGEHLPQKRNRLLTHRVGVASIHFDHLLERFFNALQKETILGLTIFVFNFKTFPNFMETISYPDSTKSSKRIQWYVINSEFIFRCKRNSFSKKN